MSLFLKGPLDYYFSPIKWEGVWREGVTEDEYGAVYESVSRGSLRWHSLKTFKYKPLNFAVYLPIIAFAYLYLSSYIESRKD